MKKNKLFLFLLLSITLCSPVFSHETTKSSKNVFLTGACGFIGSNFLTYLFNKYPQYNFIVLDALTYAGSLENIPDYIQQSDRFVFIHDSILNYPVVEQIMSQADYVVHFAAESHVTRSILDDYCFFETDLLGTRALMKALVKYSDRVNRFIHISTSEVYGTADYEPMDENHLLNPRSPYAAAKAGADRIVYAYNCTYDVPVVIIRPFNNYGPRQHLEKVIPRFLATAMRGEKLTIHGGGFQKRDWMHVRDTADALDKVIHLEDFSKIKNQVINIGSGRATTVSEIAQMILKQFNLPADHLVYQEDRPGQVECHIAGIKKAEELLGWSPIITLEEGLKETIDWYVNNQSFCKKVEDNAMVPIKTHGGKIELQ